MSRKLAVALMATVALLGGTAFAQQQSNANAKTSADPDAKGFVSYLDFGGSINDAGHVLKLDSSAGYNFSSHIGVDFGVPVYFAGGSSTDSTGAKTTFSATGMGAPYIDGRLMFKNPKLNYATTVTTFLPAGNTQNGFATGRTTFDWNNHFERSFGRFTPYGEIGVGNTVVDTSKFRRPYSSYGNNAHLEGGATFDVVDRLTVGGSGYDIAPWGTQTIYSRSMPANSANGNGATQRSFNQNKVTTGGSDLGKDHGFSMWSDFAVTPYMTAELAYTRSVTFALNTVSFDLRFNLGYLARKQGVRH